MDIQQTQQSLESRKIQFSSDEIPLNLQQNSINNEKKMLQTRQNFVAQEEETLNKMVQELEMKKTWLIKKDVDIGNKQKDIDEKKGRLDEERHKVVGELEEVIKILPHIHKKRCDIKEKEKEFNERTEIIDTNSSKRSKHMSNRTTVEKRVGEKIYSLEDYQKNGKITPTQIGELDGLIKLLSDLLEGTIITELTQEFDKSLKLGRSERNKLYGKMPAEVNNQIDVDSLFGVSLEELLKLNETYDNHIGTFETAKEIQEQIIETYSSEISAIKGVTKKYFIDINDMLVSQEHFSKESLPYKTVEDLVKQVREDMGVSD